MKQRPYQISLPRDLEPHLKAIALELGDVYKGDASPTRSITKIAAREYAVVPPLVPWSDEQRIAIQHFLKTLQTALSEQKPFRVLYRDSQGQVKDYVARYGKLSFWERRHYLEIWAGELSRKSGIDELAHNHCLRLDRILDVLPATGGWRAEGLATIAVQLELRNGLIKAYERRPEDTALDVVGDRLIVTRQISNSFWLIREVLRYGRDCVVLSPDVVRDRIREEIAQMYNNYG